VSIVDMMAHSHTKTPTKAAELIISHNRNFEDQILNHQKNLVIRTQQRLSAARQDLNRSQRVISNNSRDLLSKFSENMNELKQRIVHDSRNSLHQSHRELAAFLRQVSARPGILMAHREAELVHISAGIKTNSEKYIQKNETALGHYNTLLRMMSPDNVLKKGFAIISLHGRIVSNGQDIKPGDELTVKMAKEEISTIVKSKKQTDGK
jgi:exodeoxyribonuclease VII large subunit